MIDTVKLKITEQDVSKKQVNVVATYTDSNDPTNTKIVNIDTAIIATSAQQLAVLDVVHAHYEAQVTKATAIAAFIADLETSGAANLKARL